MRMSIRIRQGVAIALATICGAAMLHAQQVRKTMLRLPDTGQYQSYTDIPGEDSDHPSMPMGFVVQAGTVRDTVTDLMWQQTDGGEMTWAQARAYCDSLSLGGFTDWRLPSGHELFSINDLSHGNPALPSAFERTQAEYWWSVDTLASDARRIWCTNAGGGIGPHPMTESISAGGTKRFHVRAVRDVVQPGVLPAQFTESATEVVTDHVTDREWMQFCLPGKYTWEDALRAADTAAHAGYTDWRLPNVKELQSLSVRSMQTPTTDMRYFPCVTPTGSYWSSTTLVNKTLTQAWLMQADLGVVTYAEKTTAQGVLLVRSGDRLVSVDDDAVIDAETVIAFPNPTHGVVHLSHTYATVRVYGIDGAELLHATSTDVLDLTGASLGVYSVMLIDTRGVRRTLLLCKY